MKYLASDNPQWVMCDEEAPPRGVVMMFYTCTGITQRAIYDERFHVAYMPLPKVTNKMRAKAAKMHKLLHP